MFFFYKFFWNFIINCLYIFIFNILRFSNLKKLIIYTFVKT